MICAYARQHTISNVFMEIPQHVAIIMDGNRRWAREQGLPDVAGHQAGYENMRPVIEKFAARGVSFLTFFVFSTENWKREKKEVDSIMDILLQITDNDMKALGETGVKLVHVGSKKGLNQQLLQKIEDAVERTKNNDRITVCLAFNYGGQDELVEAIQGIVESKKDSIEITKDTVEQHLYTAGIPHPDIVIRTGKERRLSNFLLWQSAYAELLFLDTYWPAFSEQDVDEAIEEFSRRTRRFGGN